MFMNTPSRHRQNCLREYVEKMQTSTQLCSKLRSPIGLSARSFHETMSDSTDQHMKSSTGEVLVFGLGLVGGVIGGLGMIAGFFIMLEMPVFLFPLALITAFTSACVALMMAPVFPVLTPIQDSDTRWLGHFQND